jgi:anaerobic ribonucleoside-triphosphate reductase activating protein
MSSLFLSVAQIVDCTEAEGPGLRFSLWFQGCPLRCPGCCNPEMLSFEGGEEVSLAVVLSRLDAAVDQHEVEGVTLLGGEPFAHAETAGPLVEQVHSRGLSVMVFTGFLLEELQSRSDASTQVMLSHVDLLVDGPFQKDQPDQTRRWIGSRNQRIHFLTEFYQPHDPCWRESNTLEIRMERGAVQVNGFPAQQAVGLWRRPKNR